MLYSESLSDHKIAQYFHWPCMFITKISNMKVEGLKLTFYLFIYLLIYYLFNNSITHSFIFNLFIYLFIYLFLSDISRQVLHCT